MSFQEFTIFQPARLAKIDGKNQKRT